MVKAVFETTLKLLLSPLLLWQGLRVRKHALILPEPIGPRFGVDGNGPPLSLLILGDSSAAGVGVPTQEMALTGQLLGELAPFFTVTWDLTARTGATTATTLERLKRLDPRDYDAVVLAIGVNDITRSVPLNRWRSVHGKLFDLLQSKFKAKRIYTSDLPPMGQFPALPQPLRGIIGMTARRYDAAMARYQATRPEITRLQMDLPMDPALMAKDGFHPGAAVYTQWAQALASHIREDFGTAKIAQETGG